MPGVNEFLGKPADSMFAPATNSFATFASETASPSWEYDGHAAVGGVEVDEDYPKTGGRPFFQAGDSTDADLNDLSYSNTDEGGLLTIGSPIDVTAIRKNWVAG